MQFSGFCGCVGGVGFTSAVGAFLGSAFEILETAPAIGIFNGSIVAPKILEDVPAKFGFLATHAADSRFACSGVMPRLAIAACS